VVLVRVEAPCRPTEDPEKVRAALVQLFPDLRIEREDTTVAGTSGSLERLRDLIRTQRIRDTARGQLLAGREGDRTVVVLSKQAAAMGGVNFSAGSPLGDVRVEIESEDLATTLDSVAESTRPGGRQAVRPHRVHVKRPPS